MEAYQLNTFDLLYLSHLLPKKNESEEKLNNNCLLYKHPTNVEGRKHPQYGKHAGSHLMKLFWEVFLIASYIFWLGKTVIKFKALS